jgi:nitric oxide reductase subunit B
VDSVCGGDGLVISGPWLDRNTHLFGDAADPSAGRGDGWPDAHWHWRDHSGAECLAVDGRYGSRVDLGARQLCRSRLDGRLAASGSGLHSRPLVERRLRQRLRKLDNEQQAQLIARLTKLLHTNTYDPSTGTVTVDPIRVEAFESNLAHYTEVFSKGNADYAIPAGAVSDPDRFRKLSAFFFWTAWAASTDRPNDISTYTNNWPHEPLIGNRPTGDTIVWTGVSIIMLLAGISAMAWWYASKRNEEEEPTPPETDPLALWEATPSQKATIKYFWVVSALILVQMLLGVITAHYGVEGDGFYGFPLSDWLPYSVTRTWHVQMGLFWIATAWLAAGLFIGPLVSGEEPKGQTLGVNVLFGALLLVVVGSLTGEWLSIQNKMTDTVSFYLGHQGYEYVDLGRVWQIGLMVGLLLWLFLMIRVLLPALRKPARQGNWSLCWPWPREQLPCSTEQD